MTGTAWAIGRERQSAFVFGNGGFEEPVPIATGVCSQAGSVGRAEMQGAKGAPLPQNLAICEIPYQPLPQGRDRWIVPADQRGNEVICSEAHIHLDHL